MRLMQEGMNFDGTNVEVFKLKMESMLRIKDCWITVEEKVTEETLKEKDAEWRSKDGKARAYLLKNISDEFVELISEFKTASSERDAIERLFAPKSIGNLSSIRKRLEDFKIRESEDLISQVNFMEGLLRNVKGTELEIGDAEMVVKLMNALPTSWEAYVQGLRAVMDSKQLKDYNGFKGKVFEE
jgi:hypothetical protein